MSLSFPDLGRELTNAVIQRTVGERSFANGLTYARTGRVVHVRVDDNGRLVFGSVLGNRPSPYSVIVTPAAHGGRWTGHCTCPVGVDCKHVAAVLVAAREAAGAAVAGVVVAGGGSLSSPTGSTQSAWEGALGGLVAARTARRPPAQERFALQVEIVRTPGPRRDAPGATRLRLRPVRVGASGAWVRTGATWADVSRDSLYGGYSLTGHGMGSTDERARRQLDVLRAILATFEVNQRAHYGYREVVVHLDELGLAAWSLLAQAKAAGLDLVLTGLAAPPVEVLDPVRVLVDLTAAPEGLAKGAVLRAVVRAGDREVPREDIELMGEPAHGVLAVEPVGVVGLSGRSSPYDEALAFVDREPAPVLAPLEAPLDEHVDRLLRSGVELAIPAADLPRFLRGYLPALRQVVEVVSSDSSVALPQTVGPELALTVTYGSEHEVDLTWAFSYGGEDTHLGSDEDDLFRDPEAERRLLDELSGPVRELLGPDHGAGSQLTGMESVAVTREVLPRLRLIQGGRAGKGGGAGENAADHTPPPVAPGRRLALRVIGDVPEFRDAQSDPVIHLSTTAALSAPDAPTDWFDLGVTVSVDGEMVPFDRLFTALAQERTHLLLPSGTVMALDTPQLHSLRQLIEEARAVQDHDADPSRLRLSVFQAGLWEELVALGVVESQTARWAQAVQGLLDVDRCAPPPVPATFEAQLRPYQREGFRWLTFLWQHRLGGILADDMGLGKTVQALAMMCHARESGELTEASGPFLVVAPTSVVGNWVAEARRFAPGLKVVAVTETSAKRATPLAEDVAGMDLVITSYALFRLDDASYQALPWAGLILDEAQFVKNHQAKTYQCARRLTTPFKLAITGTPMENSLMDLWSLLSIVAPGLFPHPQRFSDVYRRPIERGDNPELLATLRRRIRPLMLRRTKEQVVADLPPKQEQVLDVVLNTKHHRIYQTHLQRERAKVLGLLHDLDRNRFEIFRSLTLLRLLALDPGLVDPAYAGVSASKVDVLMEQLGEVVAEGHRVLVFSQFTSFLAVVRARLDAAGVRYSYLDGRSRRRPAVIADWKAGDAPVFLISLKAGGVGLNLTEADYVVILDPWWNPAVEAQAVDRTHRIGQTKPVMVYRLVSVGTIEEKVMELKARKQALFSQVMDGGGLEAAPLSAADIRGLFA